jgi:hypothetical protein
VSTNVVHMGGLSSIASINLRDASQRTFRMSLGGRPLRLIDWNGFGYRFKWLRRVWILDRDFCKADCLLQCKACYKAKVGARQARGVLRVHCDDEWNLTSDYTYGLVSWPLHGMPSSPHAFISCLIQARQLCNPTRPYKLCGRTCLANQFLRSPHPMCVLSFASAVGNVSFKGISILGKNQRSRTSYLPHLSPATVLPVLLGGIPAWIPRTFSARSALRQPISTRPYTGCPTTAKQLEHIHGTCAVAFDDALGQHGLACVHLAVWSSGMILA